MSDIVRQVTFDRSKSKKPVDFRTGDTVGVYVKVKEGEKERLQLFRGVVIKVQGTGMGKSFTVRKISSGVGVERTFPFASPAVDRVEVISHGKVRRGRLYFLRNLKGKSARLRSDLVIAKAGVQMVSEGEAIGAADDIATEQAPAEAAAPEKVDTKKEQKQ